jgi:hypothetical protein
VRECGNRLCRYEIAVLFLVYELSSHLLCPGEVRKGCDEEFLDPRQRTWPRFTERRPSNQTERHEEPGLMLST